MSQLSCHLSLQQSGKEERNLNKSTTKQRERSGRRVLVAAPTTSSQAAAVAQHPPPTWTCYEGLDQIRALHQHGGQFYLSLLPHVMFLMVILLIMLFVMLLEMLLLKKKSHFSISSSLPSALLSCRTAFIRLIQAECNIFSRILTHPLPFLLFSEGRLACLCWSCFLLSLFSLPVRGSLGCGPLHDVLQGRHAHPPSLKFWMMYAHNRSYYVVALCYIVCLFHLFLIEPYLQGATLLCTFLLLLLLTSQL